MFHVFVCLRRGLRSFIDMLPTRGSDVNHTQVGAPRRRTAAACYCDGGKKTM